MPIRRLAAAAALSAAALAPAVPAHAAPSCFATCIAGRPPTTDDYFAFSDDVKACRDRCDGEALTRLKADGRYAAYAACTPEPLSRQEFILLRSSNPSWQASFNVFLWDVTNPLTDKLLTEIEVVTQDMNLIDVALVSIALIGPGERGTFVIPDFFDGYPAVRYATRVKSAKACKLG